VDYKVPRVSMVEPLPYPPTSNVNARPPPSNSVSVLEDEVEPPNVPDWFEKDDETAQLFLSTEDVDVDVEGGDDGNVFDIFDMFQ